MTILNANSIVDFIDVARFWTVSDGANALQRFAFGVPDHLILCRQNESISIVAPEQDTDATPTGDWFIRVKAVRVHPQIVSEQPQPMRLVR